jgi:hypothetical protein
MRTVFITLAIAAMASQAAQAEPFRVDLPLPGVYRPVLSGDVAAWHTNYYAICAANLRTRQSWIVANEYGSGTLQIVDSAPAIRGDLLVWQRGSGRLQAGWLMGYWVPTGETFVVYDPPEPNTDVTRPEFVGDEIVYSYNWYGENWGSELRSMPIPAPPDGLSVIEPEPAWTIWVEYQGSNRYLWAEAIAVPEPSTVTLLLLAALCIAFARPRGRRTT